MTRTKWLILVASAIFALAAAGAIFWYWRHPPDMIVSTNLTTERQAEIENELKIALAELAKDGKNIERYLVVGRLQARLGRLSVAERYYNQALKINKRDQAVYVGLGVLYRQMGRYEKADRRLRIAVELNPNDKRAFEELIDLYFAHFPDKSEELKNIFRAASDYTASPDVWSRYAKFLEDRREYREALIYYQEALRALPDDRLLKEAVERVRNILDNNQ